MPTKKATAKKAVKKSVKKTTVKKSVKVAKKAAVKKPVKKVTRKSKVSKQEAVDVMVAPVVDSGGAVLMNPVPEDTSVV